MKRLSILAAAAAAALCFAACQDLGELGTNIPFLDSESSISIKDGETLNLEVFFLNMGDNEITGTVTSDNENYPVNFAPGKGNKGTLTIGAPQYILDNTPVNLMLQITDGTRTEDRHITVKPVISALLKKIDTPSNCYIAGPGAIVEFPTNVGNTTKAAAYDTFELLWQDEQGLVAEIVKAENGKALVRFASGKTGNATFAAKKGDEIVWSWVVWVSAETPATIAWTSPDGNKYEFMDRNIGARSMDYTSDDINGLMYQWGRKDAFPAGIGGSGAQRPIYDINNTEVEMSYEGVTELNMTETSIKKPLTYFGAGSNSAGQWSWLSNDAAKLSYDEIGDYWGGLTGKKSQYDPCPAGYKVANMDAMSIWYTAEGKTITKIYTAGSTANKDILGVEVKLADGQIFFIPTQGDLAANTGAMEYNKGSNYPYTAVWTATLKEAFKEGNKNNFTGMGFRLSPTFGSISKSSAMGYSMSYTFPVRCVKE